MVAGRHNVSRRAVLGVGVVAPVLLAGPVARAAIAAAPCVAGAAGGAPGVSALAGGSGAAAGDARRAARWGRALSAYLRAADALDRFCSERLRPASAAHQALRARWPVGYDVRGDAQARALLEPAFAAIAPLEDRADDLECARLAALRRLLRSPAPDLRALALKIELVIDNQAWELRGAEPCLAALRQDARRLIGGGSANSSA
jgi:hypothetical protein